MNQLLFDASIKIVKYIQSNNYNKLNKMNCLERVSEEYIINTLKDYGGMLDVVNEQEYMKYFQYIQIKNQNRFMTYLDMIIDGERSDLTLICEIELENDRVVKILVDDLHVLCYFEIIRPMQHFVTIHKYPCYNGTHQGV
jgi:hypothetical protein